MHYAPPHQPPRLISLMALVCLFFFSIFSPLSQASRIKEVAQRHAAGRIVSVLEGGYALSALGRSVVAHLKVLGGF